VHDLHLARCPLQGTGLSKVPAAVDIGPQDYAQGLQKGGQGLRQWRAGAGLHPWTGSCTTYSADMVLHAEHEVSPAHLFSSVQECDLVLLNTQLS